VTHDEVRAFVREHHQAVLSTVRSDGRPQLSPVLVGVDPQGFLIVSTRETAIKTANVRREPFASVCVFVNGFFGAWVQAEGEAHVVSLPDAMEGLVGYYRDISGEHPSWDEYRAAMQRERRVLIRIRIDRVGPTRSG
jgi:PPOX class probable F420-dependent enzyme